MPKISLTGTKSLQEMLMLLSKGQNRNVFVCSKREELANCRPFNIKDQIGPMHTLWNFCC